MFRRLLESFLLYCSQCLLISSVSGFVLQTTSSGRNLSVCSCSFLCGSSLNSALSTGFWLLYSSSKCFSHMFIIASFSSSTLPILFFTDCRFSEKVPHSSCALQNIITQYYNTNTVISTLTFNIRSPVFWVWVRIPLLTPKCQRCLRPVVGRSSVGLSVFNITLISYTPLRYVRNVAREE